MATAPKTTSGTSSEEARKQNNKQAKNAARRKYEYPPDSKPTLSSAHPKQTLTPPRRLRGSPGHVASPQRGVLQHPQRRAGPPYVSPREQHARNGADFCLDEWTLCEKPRAEPNNGCRMGRFGFFVWYQGVLRKAIWVTRGACDYVSPGEEGDEHEVDDDEGEFEELMEGV